MSQPQLNKTILSINHVAFSYPNRNLFTDLSFSIAVDGTYCFNRTKRHW
ncbi:hypothetical protein HMPREF0518_0699 [Lactobacillus helveticus DSM 20075 = CGMCC 1.1877]|uniref:Uncharacterized protein n=1 Tax=Lactobacillus helveticus CIRM-BIA 104 TaxID=1226333 RepID=U6F8K6_LACHE|nr:hypothetical protein HMPREF0518_0699 [Lactobacillus helveticus DSM 20075 = CGMCC 1.1877]CDI59599.1 Putative uncharacterized protein [Lactobacillus helveticus CIRM-BIA 104]